MLHFLLASSLLFVSVGTNKFLKHICWFFSSIAVYEALELFKIFFRIVDVIGLAISCYFG